MTCMNALLSVAMMQSNWLVFRCYITGQTAISSARIIAFVRPSLQGAILSLTSALWQYTSEPMIHLTANRAVLEHLRRHVGQGAGGHALHGKACAGSHHGAHTQECDLGHHLPLSVTAVEAAVQQHIVTLQTGTSRDLITSHQLSLVPCRCLRAVFVKGKLVADCLCNACWVCARPPSTDTGVSFVQSVQA